MDTSTINLSALALSADRPQKVGDAYLKFRLDLQTPAVLLMKQVQEVLVLPANRLTPMPNMPPCVMGLMNRRSRILWVVDLPQMLGLPFSHSYTQQYNLVILRAGTIALGALVQRVEGMVWLPQEQVMPPTNHVPPHLVSYLRGCILQDREILLVLDAEAILQSSHFRQDSPMHHYAN
jgi:positive phototaxis protein PixI